jgi:hypothetical protein
MSELGDAIRAQADEIDKREKGIQSDVTAHTNAINAELRELNNVESELRTIAAQADEEVDGTPEPVPPEEDNWETIWEQDFRGATELDMDVWADWGRGNYGDQGTAHEDSFGLLKNIWFDGNSLCCKLLNEEYDLNGVSTPDPTQWTGVRVETRTTPYEVGMRFIWSGIINKQRGGLWTTSKMDDGEWDVPESFYCPTDIPDNPHERYNAINDYSPMVQKQKVIAPPVWGQRMVRCIDWNLPGVNASVFRRGTSVDTLQEIHRVDAGFMPRTPHGIKMQAACGGTWDSGYRSGVTPNLPPPSDKALVVDWIRIQVPK